MLTLTDSAQNTLSRFIAQADRPIGGLRIGVTAGGCSGYQYSMALEETAGEDDTVLEVGELRVFVDPESLPLLNGATVDFVESLEGAGFQFHNPNAQQSCGCGKSFC